MCMGLFIAQLDIQIVSSSLNEIGGGLSAGKDEMAWLQTSYLIAEIIVMGGCHGYFPLVGFFLYPREYLL